jgi:hypothetical protein
MKQLEKFIGLAALLLISGCAATITKDAQQVVLHTQISAVISDCKKLGIVFGEAPGGLTSLGDEIGRQQAINNMRDNAFKQYQADTVVLVNVDAIGNALVTEKHVAQGMAFKCNGDNAK